MTVAGKPWASYQETLVDEALFVATAPDAVVRGMVTRELFPPKYGYRDTPLTVFDVLNLQRYRAASQWEQVWRANWAGNAANEINASARNSGGQVPGWT